jgi:hypothetical protein
MTIPRTPFDPADCGLPSEAEIAALASEWFPEFAYSEGKRGLSEKFLQTAPRFFVYLKI